MTFPTSNPSPDDVRSARAAAALTQADCARIALLSGPPRWCEYETGARRIDATRWQYFLLMTGLHPDFECRARGGEKKPAR